MSVPRETKPMSAAALRRLVEAADDPAARQFEELEDAYRLGRWLALRLAERRRPA